jgi:glycosyltransferase involved in cell wall biosynthesis
MKIGIWHNTGAGGGARRHLYHHVKGLLEQGHEVVSCCPEFTGTGEHDIGQLVHEERISVPGRFEGSTFLHKRWGYNQALHDVMEAHCKGAAAYLDGEGIDVLLATNCALACIPAVGKFIQVPSVIYIHDSHRGYEGLYRGWCYPAASEQPARLSLSNMRQAWTDRVQMDNRRLYLRRNIDAAAAFTLRLTNSYFNREQLWRSYGLPTSVCYQGVDTSVFQCHSESRQPYVLGVGTYGVHKNIPFLIRAVAGCRGHWPLVWIGSSGARAQQEELAAYASGLGVEFRSLYGVTDAELVRYYNTASLHVCAPRLEPFGLTPLEAGACGLPVVGIREGGLRETVMDGVNGYLLDEDVESFSQKIDWLMSTHPERERLGEAGPEYIAANWTLQHSVQRLSRYLDAVR